VTSSLSNSSRSAATLGEASIVDAAARASEGAIPSAGRRMSIDAKLVTGNLSSQPDVVTRQVLA
jgi:hypothetical protein